MENALFQSSINILAVIFMIAASSLVLARTKIGSKIGPYIIIILTGMVLSNLNVVPASHEVYTPIFTYCIPLTMSMFLMSVPLNGIKKMSKNPWIAVLSATLSVCVVAIIGGVIFAPFLENGWMLAGMFVGTYTGGSPALSSIGQGLGASQQMLAMANVADYVVGIPILMVLYLLPPVLNQSKKFQKIWPYRLTDEERLGDGNHEKLMEDERWNIVDIAVVIGLAFLVFAISSAIANFFFSEEFAGSARLILLTTFSLLLAQIPYIKNIRGKMNLGMYISLPFLAVVGFGVNLKNFVGGTPLVIAFALFVILGALLLHVFVMRILKVKYEYMMMGVGGAVADAPTIALLCTSGGWYSVISVGMIMGLLGNVFGNYVGVAVAHIVRILTGG